jgi:hypothetical protein
MIVVGAMRSLSPARLGLAASTCNSGLAGKPFTKHLRFHLPRKRSGLEGVHDAVQPAWNDSGAVFEQTAGALRYALSTLIGFIGMVFGSKPNFSSTAVFVNPAASTVTWTPRACFSRTLFT